MSPAATSAAEKSQWLAQLATMREAIRQLKLPVQTENNIAIYGQDLLLRPEDYNTPPKGDDLWDFVTQSDEDQEYNDAHDSVDNESKISESNNTNGLIWLESKCAELARGHSGLDSWQLQEQIISLLSSKIHGTASLFYSP